MRGSKERIIVKVDVRSTHYTLVFLDIIGISAEFHRRL